MFIFNKDKNEKQKQDIKLNLLKRDDYRCGIHLGGCGKKITLKEMTVDHIIPQNINPKDKLIEIKKGYKRRTKESLAKGLFGLQPMCSECNNSIKQGVFPPRNLNKRCSNECCKFIYHKEKNKWHIVFSHYLIKKDDNSRYKDGSPKGKVAFLSMPLEKIGIEYSDGTIEEGYYLFGRTKDGILSVIPNKIGGLVSESDMIRNNKRYNEQEIFDSRKRLLVNLQLSN